MKTREVIKAIIIGSIAGVLWLSLMFALNGVYLIPPQILILIFFFGVFGLIMVGGAAIGSPPGQYLFSKKIEEAS